jgi:hypothetical protein
MRCSSDSPSEQAGGELDRIDERIDVFGRARAPAAGSLAESVAAIGA